MFRFFVRWVVVLAVSAMGSFASLQGARLDIAVLELGGLVDRENIEKGLEGVKSLREAVEGDRFVGGGELVRGVPVLFSQHLVVASGGEFGSSTRIGGGRAEVEGKLAGGKIGLRVVLSEGNKAPLRRFSQSSWAGSEPLVVGEVEILVVKKEEVRRPTVKRGASKTETQQTTTVVIYQFRN